MKSILGIDIETYCPVPLPKAGVYKYVDTDEFEILLFSYAMQNQSVVYTPESSQRRGSLSRAVKTEASLKQKKVPSSYPCFRLWIIR